MKIRTHTVLLYSIVVALFVFATGGCKSVGATAAGAGAGAAVGGPVGALAGAIGGLVGSTWNDIVDWWTRFWSRSDKAAQDIHNVASGGAHGWTFWIVILALVVCLWLYLTKKDFRALVNQVLKHLWALVLGTIDWIKNAWPMWVEQWKERKPEPIVKAPPPA